MTTQTRPRVVVIGLDCLTPQLFFDAWLDELPTFNKLVEAGTWGRLRSVDPPITVPAWSCMMSGYNPSQLGLYGFRHRRIGTYDALYFATSERVTKPRVWDRLGAAGLSSGIMGVPQTFPVKKLKGWMVSGFLAPDTDAVFTFPDPLKEQLDAAIGAPYMLDVDDFRSDDRERILRDIHTMTERRFKAFRHLVEKRACDFMMVVEMGSDRIHHAFWRYIDPTHRLYEPGNRFEHSVLDYYKKLDDELAATLALLDDDCQVYVVSDHGARPMHGGFCINDWLREQGLLTLTSQPAGQTKFKESMVDWSRTKVWAWGGYYARIFVNLEGREPQGQVPAADYEAFLAELTERLMTLDGPDGEPMGNRVMRPKDLSPDGTAAGDWPDLMVYFGDLAYRSIGSVGNDHEGFFVFSNDTGPDDANHDHDGIFVHARVRDVRAGRPGPGERQGLRLVDVGPTIVASFGVETPADAAGQPMRELFEAPGND